jgi:hypothetical protein
MDDADEQIEIEDEEVQQPVIEPPRVKRIEVQSPTIDSARVIPTESPNNNDTRPVEPVREEPDVVSPIPPVPPVPTTANDPDDEPMTMGEVERLMQQFAQQQISRPPCDAGVVDTPASETRMGADWLNRMPRLEDVPSPIAMTATATMTHARLEEQQANSRRAAKCVPAGC